MPLPFRKSKDSKNVDVDEVVKKLKSLYATYAEKYGSKMFNLKGFEDRYRNALVKKLNLNAFLHAEITVFEELKKRLKPTSTNNREKSYSEIADQIIEENLERIRKYRMVDFHPDAEEETKYLFRAVTDFYYDVWGKVGSLLRPFGFSDIIAKLENDFSYYVIPTRGSYSRAVEDYLYVLSRKSPKDNERASVNFIKYGGILLNNCLKLINDGLNAPGRADDFQEVLLELEKCKENLEKIIDDFRLNDIRGY